MDKKTKKHYEDSLSIIEECLTQNRSKWNQNSVKWKQWEDVKQDIKIHLFKKWHKYDHDKPLKPWVNGIIRNQIFNIKRNIWGKHAKPCYNCPASLPNNMCKIFGVQSQECMKYNEWSVKKECAYNLNNASDLESAESYIDYSSSLVNENYDYEFFSMKSELEEELMNILSPREKIFYQLFFIQEDGYEFVAEVLEIKIVSRKETPQALKIMEKKIKEEASRIMNERSFVFNNIKGKS